MIIKVVSQVVEDAFSAIVAYGDLAESSTDLLIIGKALGYSEEELSEQFPMLTDDSEETVDEDDDSDE